MMNKNVEALKKYYDNATKEQVIEYMFLDICNLQMKIDKVIECIKNIKPLSLEETALKESIKQAYYESSHIKNCKESFDMVCHLEDFEIAIWNILETLGGDVDDE